ncbi:MAG: hypothetical protein GY820_25880, partial [Gammaproteobacteria bacterium]|nr:hypothetical protein [Gammaproteobacteria bacterium]
SQETFEEIQAANGQTIQMLPPTISCVSSASGHDLHVKGSIIAQIAVPQHTFYHRLHVANLTQADQRCIFGLDLLKRFGKVSFDFTNDQLTLSDLKSPCTTIQSTTSQPNQLLLLTHHHVTIPAASLHRTMVYNPQLCSEPTDVLFAPNYDKLFHHQLTTTDSILQLKDGLGYVWLANHNNYPVNLYEATKLGSVEVLDGTEHLQPLQHTDTKLPTTWSIADVCKQVNVSSCDTTLSGKDTDQLVSLLTNYHDIFSKHGRDRGHTNKVQHHIETTGTPFKLKPYPVPFAKRAVIEQHVKEQLEDGVIEPSNSPYSSPALIVSKKDSSIGRFCVDYRMLNLQTVKDNYPLSRTEDVFMTLGNNQYFSTLDISSAYWQVEVAPEHRHKTAFTTGFGLFQYRFMPFGLTNSPATFQRLMENVLNGLLWKTCFVFIDDVLVTGRTFSEHLENLEEVFQRLRDANLKLKLSKCFFCKPEVPYLGHVLSKHGIKTDPQKTAAIQNMAPPNNVKELQRFLGMVNYYTKFVSAFSQLASPLHKLLQKSSTWKWSPICQEAFLSVKKALTNPPLLAYPKFDHPFFLQTDASKQAISGVLGQRIDGQEKIVAY